MLRPLEQFICDTCGDIIENLHDGYVEWEEGTDDNGHPFARDFRIVHHRRVSPIQTREGCYTYGNSNYRHDMHLEHFLAHVHQYLTSFMDLGMVHDSDSHIGCRIVDFREFTEFVRRLTIPYYEEARRYIPEAIQEGYMQDVNEIGLYTPEYLQALINHFNPQ